MTETPDRVQAPERLQGEELARLASMGDPEALDRYLDSLEEGSAARLIDRLDTEDQKRLLTTLTPKDAADLIEEIPEAQAVELIKELAPADAAAIVTEMHSDEQADLIATLVDHEAEAILAEMDAEAAAAARRLAGYPPDVAGGLMITEYVSVSRHATVEEIIDKLRSGLLTDHYIQYIYVLSRNHELVGVLRLRNLITAPPDRKAGDIMIPEPLSVRDTAPIDELDALFARQTFLGLPVVDGRGRLLGVVRRYDVEAALTDRTEDDYRKSQGIVSGEELRSMPIFRRSTRRLSWLTINIGLNILAASVIALYQDTLSSVIALAVFLPIISDMSGCSGSQAVAVSMRELSLGLVTPSESLRVWVKEILVGIVNGLVLGLLLALAAWAWKGNPFLGLVVGTAMAANTLVAVSIGGTVPLLLKRFRMDPALASGPILTTITDMCGFFLVLSLASAMLRHLI